jgi:methionyl-tRNA formyltransferase
MNCDRAEVILIGLGPTAQSALDGLLDRFAVVALVRDAVDQVAHRAQALGVPVVADTSLSGVRQLVGELRPDAVVVSSYDRILPAELLQICPFVNVHYAPLPRYRGRATVNWAIINGEPTASICIHSLVPGLDAGGILYRQEVPIDAHDTVTDVYFALNALQKKAIADAVGRRIAGEDGEPQDNSAATYACSRLPDDGEIDWGAPSIVTDRLIRALAPPYPGAFSFLGLRRLWIRRATIRTDAPRYEGRLPGRVVGRSAEGWADVLTGDGILRLHEVQFEGEHARPASDVIGSVRQTLGLRVRDLLAKITELDARPGGEHQTNGVQLRSTAVSEGPAHQ